MWHDRTVSIITKRGDAGTTDLMFGKSCAKTDRRVEVLGALDELNAALGVVRVCLERVDFLDLIDGLQQRLVAAMGLVATLPEDLERYRSAGYRGIEAADVEWLERHALACEQSGVRFTDWARPGEKGALASAQLDLARTVARRAERALWQLHAEQGPLTEAQLLFANRVSDLLWLMARTAEIQPEQAAASTC